MGLIDGQELQTGGAHGDGHGNGHQFPRDGAEGVGWLPGGGQIPVDLAEPPGKIQGGNEATYGDTGNGGACGQRDPAGVAQDAQRQYQSGHQLDHSLQNLTDGGGSHVPQPLREAPVGGHQAHEKCAGAQTEDGSVGIGLILEDCQRLCKGHHEEAADQAKDNEDGTGGGIDLAGLVVLAQRAGLADHAAQSHRQTGGADQQQHGVDLISGAEVAEALIADNQLQRDLVQRADDLDNGGGQCQQGGTVEKGLLFRGICHRCLLIASRRRKDGEWRTR